VRDGQFHGVFGWFDLEDTARIAFGLQLRFPFVAPFYDKAFEWNALDNLANIGDLSAREMQFLRRTGFPIALAMCTKPVLLHEFAVREGVPQFFRRGLDIGGANEFGLSHGHPPARLV
jgi:hypothetical protein